MTFLVEFSLWGQKLLIFRSKNRELLEIDFFLPLRTYFGSSQTTKFGEYFLGTLGDALMPRICIANSLSKVLLECAKVKC